MNKTKYLLLILLAAVFIFILCPPQKHKDAAVADAGITEEEYGLYSELLNPENSDKNIKLFVISNETSLGLSHLNESSWKYVKSKIPGLPREVFMDLILKNEKRYILEKKFTSSKNFTVVDGGIINDIFKDAKADGWKVFYKHFPYSQGIMSFSRAGFNKDKTQALFYSGSWSNWQAGVGYLYYCLRENGKWLIKGKAMVWIS